MFEIAVTLKGKTLNEVIDQAKALVEAGEGGVVTQATRGKKGKSAAAVAEVEADEEMLDESEAEVTTEDDDNQMGFDMDADTDSEAEVEEPAKPAKKAKLTDKQVNEAAMKHAKKHGRPATLKILEKKFKVKSILELKPEQYAQVIAALKV